MCLVCCCLRGEESEDYVNPNSPTYRNCICLSCFLQNFSNMYTSIFPRSEVHSLPSSVQGTASSNSTTSLDNSISDMYRSPPPPLPYDVDPRSFRMRRERLVSTHEKGSSNSHEETEPLTRSDAISGEKWNDSCASEEGSKEPHSKSSMKFSSAEMMSGTGIIYSSAEEEDACPTCLDGYTEENPKIITKCSHHFHLGCIYEWMERSDTCPVCLKVMVFDET